MKITPAFFSSSLKVVTTDTESNTASTAILGFCDAGQDLLLAQRNAELLIGLENFRIDLVERFRTRLALRRRVVADRVLKSILG
jgi:hypothetical protein